MASGSAKSGKDRIVYTEFGAAPDETATPQQSDVPPAQQTLKIQASRKGRKGKTVTVVSGFQLEVGKIQTLGKQLKAQCGTGGTVKGNTVEIQGDHRAKLQKILTDLGYRTKLSGG